METYLLILGGLALLLLGGEWLVRGAVRVAEMLNISPIVIGLTLVGFGTSTPELVTSLQAVINGSAGVAYGNIVGSNIANILLILGVSACIFPIRVHSRSIKRDGMVMLFATALFVALASIGLFNFFAGLSFVILLGIYIVATIWQEKSSTVQPQDAPRSAPKTAPKSDLLRAASIAVLGLILIIFGGKFLVTGATSLARGFGISETVIGLTIVAIGTSLPELVTSVIAALKRQSDIAFGNVIGSNIYNILGISGITAMFSSDGVPSEIIQFDNWVMLAVSILMVFFAYTSLRIARWEGVVLLFGYVLYVFAIWP